MTRNQQSKTQSKEILLKELNDLRSRVKKLEELSQQRIQQQTLKKTPVIQIPIRLDMMANDQDSVSEIGVGKATKKMTKEKC